MKVHATIAKQMLYEFHKTENRRKPKSVAATYLVDGALKLETEQSSSQVKRTNGDSHMQSSPFMSSAPQPDDKDSIIPVRQISLVLEDHLEGK